MRITQNQDVDDNILVTDPQTGSFPLQSDALTPILDTVTTSHTDLSGHLRRGVPSITDVARLAGVSNQTVSRVANDSPKVRPSTRDKVKRAMDELGYTPNRAARALRVGSYNTIGVILHRLDRAGEVLTIEAVVRAAEKHEYATTLIQISDPETGGLQEATHRLSAQAVDGVIIVRAGTVTADLLRLPADFPVVVADPALLDRYPTVMGDQVGGTRQAINHLLNLGHRNIFHVSGSLDSSPARDRMHAWEQCLLEHGITPMPPWHGDWSPESGYLAGQHIAKCKDVTAVFCANDEMAFGLMRALHENGLRVPEDLSVVGFDSIALSEFSSPPLTTVAVDYDALGSELFHLLIEKTKDRMDGPLERVLVPTELVIRGTTAPVPAGKENPRS